jgi:hypothetical protein
MASPSRTTLSSFVNCSAAATADWAEQLNEALENVGVLFDEIFSTRQKVKSKVDIERDEISLPQFGPGQLLFLTGRANLGEAERHQAAGLKHRECLGPKHANPLR